MNTKRFSKALAWAIIDMVTMLFFVAGALIAALFLVAGVQYLVNNGMAYIIGSIPFILVLIWCFYLFFIERYDEFDT